MQKLIIFNAGSSIYGAERGLLNLIRALDNQYDITVIIPSRGPLMKKLEELNITVKFFPLPVVMFSFSPFYYFTLPFLTIINIIYFILFVKRINATILCTNSLLLFFPGIVALLTGKKHIWYVREFFSIPFLDRAAGKLVSFLSDIVICQSHTIQQVLSIEKAQVIYEPIDPSNYKLYDPPAVRQEFNFALDSFIIGVIARIHPAKGQYEFIKAMAEELRRDSKLFIIIAGDIVPRTLKNRLYKRKIENFIQQNQLKNVILLGFRDDIDKILSLCDICVYPFSRREPFGIAAAESLAFNKPTLFPKCGGLQEISDIFEKGEDFSIKKVKDRIALLTKSPHRGQSLISIPNKLSFGNYKDAVHNVFKN